MNQYSADGNLIAEYSYDEWGKLLGIETAEENNEVQRIKLLTHMQGYNILRYFR
ncbi:MAG: hypothetical protein LUG21_00650 [Clostridiales bacterium]|nr:hypothetical protein [Clostridiales bacterium]